MWQVRDVFLVLFGCMHLFVLAAPEQSADTVYFYRLEVLALPKIDLL